MVGDFLEATQVVWVPGLIIFGLALLSQPVIRYVDWLRHAPGGSHDHGPACGERGLNCSIPGHFPQPAVKPDED